jgi:hypothetical protein
MNIDPSASQADVKRFADRVLKRLERDGASLKFPQILEALSAGFGERNWSALCGRLSEGKISGDGSSCTGETASSSTPQDRSMAANIQWSWRGQPRICTVDDHNAGRDQDIVCWHVPRGEGPAFSLRLIRLLTGQRIPVPILVIHAPWMDEADVRKLETANGSSAIVLTRESIVDRQIDDSKTLCDELEMLFLAARQEGHWGKAPALGSVERDSMAIRSLSMQSAANRTRLESEPLQAGGATWDGTYHWSYPSHGMHFAPRNRRSPFQNGYSANINLIVGPPGHGKSVMASSANLDLMLAPTANRTVPMLGMVDVGNGAANAFALMSGIFNSRGKGRALHRKWNALSKERVNIFDTRLGCRSPGKKLFTDAVHFLCLLSQQSGHGLDRGVEDLCEIAVREVYERFSDLSRGGRPKCYVAGKDTVVDSALAAHAIHVDEDTTWWKCTDSLFAAGNVGAAHAAQSHAVPLVEDAIQILNTPVILDIFGDATIEGGERLIGYFQRMLTTALRAYPALSGPGSLDIKRYDAVCLDIDMRMGSGTDDKAMAVSALLARHAVSWGMYPDMYDGTMVYPEQYEAHLRQEADAWRERPHALTWDECHRYSAFTTVCRELERDMREGRKWGVDIIACSQLASVFEGGISSLATGVWLMGTGTQAQADATARALNLPQDAIRHASEEAWEWSPTKGFKALNFNIGDPRIEKLRMVRFRFDAGMLWALCTSTAEAALLKELSASVGVDEAIRRLSIKFPEGPGGHVYRRRSELEKASKGPGHPDRYKSEAWFTEQAIREMVATLMQG